MPCSVLPTAIPDVLILEPQVFEDSRGFVFESFNIRDFERATGLTRQFVQDNHTYSIRGVVRGLHFQVAQPQGKLVRVVHGEVFDVAVDLRRSSPTFRHWVGVVLSAENKRQLWVPEGFAHGYAVTSHAADVLYKCTNFWYPEHERSLLWNDADLSIEWPLVSAPILSPRDAAAPGLNDIELD